MNTQETKRFNIKTKYIQSSDAIMALERYGNGRRAITFYDEEQGPLLTATVNVPYLELKDDEVIVKDYSENEGILQSMIDNGIVSEPIDTVPLGFVEGHVCKFLL